MAQKFDPETNSWFFYGKIKDALGIQRQYKKRGFPTKKAAKKAEIEFRENAIAPPAKITMFALEEEFIAWMKRQITESSINSYHYLFDRINARFGDIPPTAITSQLLQLYIDELDENIIRITSPDCPIPYSPVLEDAYVPNSDKVVEKVMELF